MDHFRDEDDDLPPVCGTCMGAGGEWIDQNGTGRRQSTWICCLGCDGTGRR